MCSVALGTSGVVFSASRDFAMVPDNALHAFAHADGRYHFMQIELFRAFKVFLTSDVVSLNIIKYKSIAQILNVLADGYMIGWSLICCQ